jgi:predicted O-methyltransferase YrrM
MSDGSEISAARRALRKGRSEASWRRRKSWLRLRARLLHPRAVRDLASIRARNDELFEQLGVPRGEVEKLCSDTLASLGREFRPRKESIHYLAFAALRASGFAPENVLEVGTYRGETTQYLAQLFPKAKLFTIELPEDDPLISEYHTEKERADRVAAELRALPQVATLRINTVDLQRQDFPAFDLVWLDGGHYFPEVAWDHFYCVDHLAPGGWLFSDDVILPGGRFYDQPEHLDVHKVLEYIGTRRQQDFGLLVKREDPLRYQVSPKYVAYLRNED